MLTGLATGQLQNLSRNLIVAFATTVLGLVIAGASYGMSLIRRRWYARDLSDLEYLHDRLFNGGSHHGWDESLDAREVSGAAGPLR